MYDRLLVSKTHLFRVLLNYREKLCTLSLQGKSEMRKDVTQIKNSMQHNVLAPSQPASEREEVAAIHIYQTADVWVDKCNQRVHKES